MKGLNQKEVEESRKKYGTNIIPESEPTTFWEEFKETFEDPMIKILIVIAILMIGMFFLGYAEIYEPIGIIVAIIIVAVISAKTGVISDTKYRKLKESTKKDRCKVYRNGAITTIEIDEVVVGDKILLQSGDKIPADGILIEGSLSVDNSALNGETEECKKYANNEERILSSNVTSDMLTDTFSLFRGSVVFSGEGILEVHKVGMESMMGKMAEDMQDEEPDSPLKVKLSKLAKQISMFGYIGAVVIAICYMTFFIIHAGGLSTYLVLGWTEIIKDLIEALSLAVVIIVCAVPEGLPLMISLVLMQNTSKMLDHNILVRKAEGIETAGSLNILFSDKTGTITKGSLEVVEFFTANGKTLQPQNHKIKTFIDVAIGKNTASMFDEEHKIIGGNATDRALLNFIGEESYIKVQSNRDYIEKASQGFNSINKFSQVEINNRTYYKGAPDKFIDIAKKALNEKGEIVDLDIEVINKKINQLASKAMRILALGYSESSMKEDQINEDLILIGFIAIRDDIRPEAKKAIHEVIDAGIQVVMITGDKLETAVAIAKDTGLIQTDKDIALTSKQLNSMSDKELKKIMPNIKVIARALPTDKSRMIRICQDMNLVVGMTGDGVNDSPALKRADVGFAMGSGTEAAKEASDIVILDDNFKSIKSAILYGRTIYNNILKFCKFQLVINVAAVIISAISPFFGIEEPLKVTHLLFVNLVMDGLGAIMLGNEPALKKYMKEKPRQRDESIVSKKMMAQIIVMGIWLTFISFIFLKLPFFDQFFRTAEQKYTAYFVLFIVSALFNGFNVRDEGFGIFRDMNKNPGFLKVWFMIVAVQFMIVNAALIPLDAFKWISTMFSCEPFGIKGWAITFILAATMIPIDLMRKVIVNRNKIKTEGKLNQVETIENTTQIA